MTAPDRIWATTSNSMGWKAGYCTDELDDVKYENVHEYTRTDIHDAVVKENERLREALRPFADAAEIKLCGEWKDDESIQRTDVSFFVKFGHLRAARAALK